MIDVAIDEYPDEEFVINDLSSAIFNTFLGIGQIMGPLYGALMTHATSFSWTADVLGIFCLCFGVLYFFICNGPEAFKNSQLKDGDRGLPLQ